MKTRFKQFIKAFCSFLIGAFFLFSCGEKEPSNVVPPSGGEEDKPNVVVLGQNEKSSVKEIQADGTIVFDGTEMANKLLPGTILCSGPAENAPYGFLYKVKAVRKDSDRTIVSTEFAAFEEAVENGTANETFELTDHIERIVDWQGNPVEYTKTKLDISGGVSLPFEVKIPKPASSGALSADFYLKGRLDIKATFHVDIAIRKFKLELFEMWAQPEFKFSLTVGSKITGKVEFERFRLFTIDLEPITIIVMGVPLVIVPKVAVDVTPSAEGTISLDTKLVDIDFKYKAGIEYTRANGWKLISEDTSKKPVFFSESAKLEMEGELKFSPSVSVIPSFYGLSSEKAEAGIDLGIPLKLKIYDFDLADITQGYVNPKMKITWGIEAGAHATLKVLSYDLVDFRPKVTFAELVLFEGHMFPVFSKMKVNQIGSDIARISFTIEDIDDCFFTTLSDYGFYWVRGEWIFNVDNPSAKQVGFGFLDLSKIERDYSVSPQSFTFESDVSDLIPNTVYTVRPYSVNLLGERRGDANVFTNELQLATIEVNPTEIDFGEVIVGSSKSETVRISNTGTGPLTFHLSGGGGDFSYDPVDEVTVERGQTRDVTITFQPTGVYQCGEVFRVFSNASNGTQFIDCKGQGVETQDNNTETISVNGVSFKMVKVDGGTFMMGSPDADPDADEEYSDEKPQHQVTLSTYSIGETEVTQELWQAVMGGNPSLYTGSLLPVENISWEDCQSFISKLNSLTGRTFRLPTEAEWEYAARGGKNSKGYKFSGSNDVDAVAWNYTNCDGSTQPVATKRPNELGLYDMSGNVWEWCLDWYDFNYYTKSPVNNPCNLVESSYRINRGGSIEYVIKDLRVAMRGDYVSPPSNRLRGLRLVLSNYTPTGI